MFLPDVNLWLALAFDADVLTFHKLGSLTVQVSAVNQPYEPDAEMGVVGAATEMPSGRRTRQRSSLPSTDIRTSASEGG